MASTVKTTENSQLVARDFSHEPMFAIFNKYDKDQDGFLKKGEVSEALAEAGILVVDEDLAFEWLDRYFDNQLSYKEFRRASEKAPKLCPVCQYDRPDSSESEDAQEDLLRTYWRKFDAERNGWCYANVVIDYLAKDWGVQVEPEQRLIEQKLLGADQDGKINYRQFKNYFTAVPEEDLKRRVSSIGGASAELSFKKFERQLDDMLLSQKS